MKIFGVLLISLFAVAARAESYRYTCKLLTDYELTEQIEVSEDSMKMFDQYDGFGSGKRGTVVFDNAGIQGGKGKMKGRVVFSANYDKSEVAAGEIGTYYLSPELLTGGMKLKNGSKGGFMSFAGQGYSWESYICFLND